MPRALASALCVSTILLLASREASAQIRIDRGGSSWAVLEDNGGVYIGGSRAGEISSSGTVYVGGSSVGEVSSNGSVYLRGSRVAEVASNGTIYVNGSSAGEITASGRIYARGSSWGSASNCCSASETRRVAAVLLFFAGGAFELSRATATTMTVYRRGNSWARVEDDGDVYLEGSYAGRVEDDGDVYVQGNSVGRVEEDGDIYHRGNYVGRVETDGDLYLRGNSVGRIEDDGDIYIAGSNWGRATECCASVASRPRIAALLYFFEGGAFELDPPPTQVDGGSVLPLDASGSFGDASVRTDASTRTDSGVLARPLGAQCYCRAVGPRPATSPSFTFATLAAAFALVARRRARVRSPRSHHE